MLPSFDPKTYPDVLKDIAWWLVILLVVVITATPYVLPSDVKSWLGGIGAQWPSGGLLEPYAIVVVLGTVLAYFFTIHEKYEKWVLRWRVDYDLTFILPALVAPFQAQLDPAFVGMWARERRRVMNRLFYDFVRDGSPVIDENFVVRFYMAITGYWITVTNELVLVTFGAVAGLSLLASGLRGGDMTAQAWALAIVGVFVAMNRVLMKLAERRARRATEEEIDAIVDGHRSELRRHLADLHSRLGLTFRRG